jgi:hypothetical protein
LELLVMNHKAGNLYFTFVERLVLKNQAIWVAPRIYTFRPILIYEIGGFFVFCS